MATRNYSPWMQMGSPTPSQDPFDVATNMAAYGMIAPQSLGPRIGAEAHDSVDVKNKNEKQNSVLNKISKVLYRTPEEQAGLIDQAKKDIGYDSQLSNQQSLNELIGNTLVKPKLDLSPLINLADIWSHSGGQLNKSYTPPPKLDQKALVQYAKENLAGPESLQNQLAQALKMRQAGQTEELATEKTSQGQEGAVKMQNDQKNPAPKAAAGLTPAQLMGAEDKLIKEGSKISDDFRNKTSAISVIKTALDKGDLQSVKSVIPAFAQQIAADRARLTNMHLTSQLPRTLSEDMAKLEAYMNSDPNAPVNPQVISGLKSALVSAAKVHKAAAQASMNTLISSKKASPGHAAVQVDKILKPQLDEINSFEPGKTQMDTLRELLEGK
jgi:hypothetical protein